jgi:hypothetical protein
MSILEESL